MLATTTYLIVKFSKKERKKFNEKYDKKLFTFCLHRRYIVCPACFTANEVSAPEEQFNVDWCCEVCGCEFIETPTHTIMKGV